MKQTLLAEVKAVIFMILLSRMFHVQMQGLRQNMT